MNTMYDVESIAKKRRSEIFCSVFWCVFGILLLLASILAIIFKGTNTLIFIISSLCAVISLCMLFYEKRNAKFGSTKTYVGVVEKVDVKVVGIKTVSENTKSEVKEETEEKE